MKGTHRYAFILALFLMIISCQDSDGIIVMKNIDNQWHKRDAKVFDFDITDNQSQKNVIFIVRNNNNYPYSNIRLIANIEHQNKTISTDTLNYVLAKPNGEWLGKGFGDTKEVLFLYKSNYIFPEKGKYTFRVVQAMRRDTLPGIEDLGINIQTIKP